MTRFARLGLLLLPLILSGCFHRKSAPPLPPQAQAPATPNPANQNTAQQTAPPLQTIPPPLPTTIEDKPEPPKPAPKLKHSTQTTKKTKPPATKSPTDSVQTTGTTASAQTSKPAAVQQAAVEGMPTGSPIGQITSGDSGNSAQRHKEALQVIETTNQGLTNLKRSLSDQEQETATQIKTFLKQAKEALNAEDVDGAMNLANKAKVLLAELTK